MRDLFSWLKLEDDFSSQRQDARVVRAADVKEGTGTEGVRVIGRAGLPPVPAKIGVFSVVENVVGLSPEFLS